MDEAQDRRSPLAGLPARGYLHRQPPTSAAWMPGREVVTFEAIHNYYEHLVFRKIAEAAAVEDANFLEDVACVALNHLPPRYVRQSIDLLFYMSSDEYAEMLRRVDEAVENAIAFVQAHRKRQGKC